MATGRLFRFYVVLGAAFTVTAGVFGAAQEGSPPNIAVLAFMALIVYSQHRAVEFTKGSAVTADFLILMAAVVGFSGDARYTAPMLVGAARGIYLPHLRAHSWSLILLNAFTGAVAAFAAACFLAFLPADAVELPAAIMTAFATSAVCVVTLWITLAFGQVLRGYPPKMLVTSFAPMAAESLPLCILGFFVGRLYFELGAAVMLLIIVPILIAREMFSSYMKVKESHDETVQMLIRALEKKDQYTAGHSGRVATYAEYMGQEFKFGPGRMERLRFGALMHDIGKLVVPNHILNKPGKLTEEEFAKIRLHEQVTVQMLSHIDFLRPIAAGSHGDAMRFDPDDPERPIEPYMVMIADAYDAMTSTRSYRKALPQEVAFEELRNKAGTQFHPECVEALIRAIEKRGEHHGAGFEEETEFEHAPEAGLGSAGLGDLLSAES